MGQPLIYALDACALIALLKRETGWDVVDALFKRARAGEITLCMSIINLLEVIYGFRRDKGVAYAAEILKKVYSSPISIIDTISQPVFDEVSRLKSAYKMSLADAVGLATAVNTSATFVTADHHELDTVASHEPIPFLWIR
jgi:predicted nucleic acid-binding protein